MQIISLGKVVVTTSDFEYMGLPIHSEHDVEAFDNNSCVYFKYNGKSWKLAPSHYDRLTRISSVQPTKSPIVSDGGSSSYYTIPLPDNVIEKIVKNRAIETEDILKYGLGNDFDFSNAGKSLIRLWGTVNGAGKAGNDAGYEIKKIRYSLNKIEKFFVNK